MLTLLCNGNCQLLSQHLFNRLEGLGEVQDMRALLFLSKSLYETDLLQLELFEGTKTKTKSKGVQQSSTYPKATKQYAISCGLLRGAYGGGDCDRIITNDEVPLGHDSMDEGLYTLVQMEKCRRKVLTAVYRNANPYLSRCQA